MKYVIELHYKECTIQQFWSLTHTQDLMFENLAIRQGGGCGSGGRAVGRAEVRWFDPWLLWSACASGHHSNFMTLFVSSFYKFLLLKFLFHLVDKCSITCCLKHLCVVGCASCHFKEKLWLVNS